MLSNNELKAIHNSKIGFEFEFFSDLDLQSTKESLSHILNKRIRIEDKGHSDFSPTKNVFKLEPDNSGGTGLIELVTGSTPFPEAKLILSKTLKWIRENGSTNDRCSIHINISFDGEKMGVDLNITNLDIGKFVLSFNEDYVYELFPDRKDSVYAKSIKRIRPIGEMSSKSDSEIDWKNFSFVNEKYYGVNFTKAPKGYLEFRYLGGTNYEKKYGKILSLTEHFIVSIYRVLTNPKYSNDDLNELDRLIEENSKIIKSYRSYKEFNKNFPDIKLYVNLNKNISNIETFYPRIRGKLFSFITESGLTKGLINYDSDISRLQVKDADLSNCFLIEGVDIVECKINGNVKNCDIFDCEILNSSLFLSNVFGFSKIKDSKIEDSYVSRNVDVIDSYIFGPRGVFSGNMQGGIFRKGRATENSKFKNVEIIEIEKIK